ncbi:MAG: hypothetical protein MZV64_50615 [Ignavibacteriales bacterium]|nr:hypothetical protein [Ignavibacteriales bacterium]
MNELEVMNEDFSEVFVLKEYSGLSYKEIASLLEIDEDLVKSRLYKARQKLINKISKICIIVIAKPDALIGSAKQSHT